jgi:hypothetical protein
MPSLPPIEPPAADPPLSDLAQRLGHAGLLPFTLGAALTWLVNDETRPYVSLALSAWASTVLAMLGGIHWGLGFRHRAPAASLFGWGVTTSLLAWVAVMMPANAGLVLDGVMLLACYLVDRRVYPVHGIGRWLTLRFRLSLVAAICCFLGAAGA